MEDPENITDSESDKKQSDLVRILEATASGTVYIQIASTISKSRDKSSVQTSTTIIADQIGKDSADQTSGKTRFKPSVGTIRKEIMSEFADQKADISVMQFSDIRDLCYIALPTQSRYENAFSIQINDLLSISREL